MGGWFYLHFADEHDLALARRTDAEELDQRLLVGREVERWHTVRYDLGNGIVTDYLANSDAVRLCSRRLREVVDRNRGELDSIQWLPAEVVGADGEATPYWVLHFIGLADVLHKTRSLHLGGVLVKPCFDATLLSGHNVFTFRHYGVDIVIADAVKREIEIAGCGGMKFSRARVA